MMGLSDLNGNGICSTGEKYDIFYEGIREHIKNGEVFISNVLKDKTEMLIFIAIPFKSENQIRGILWGKYALMDMVGNLDFSDTSYKYFQIIDDQGNYLLPSSKQLIQGDAARGAPETIWDSLNTYHYTDSMSPNQLYESIQNRESGSFYLESEEKGAISTTARSTSTTGIYSPFKRRTDCMPTSITREKLQYISLHCFPLVCSRFLALSII